MRIVIVGGGIAGLIAGVAGLTKHQVYVRMNELFNISAE